MLDSEERSQSKTGKIMLRCIMLCYVYMLHTCVGFYFVTVSNTRHIQAKIT